ncbi:hypothetical protein QWY84_11865 [Aquisalimonas lutea]|uniref:hypothetical protein n=1 Tax=Aquisalimonas lutea TaxID=1327750 RepID=UPI0025B46A53|nr:hypothetical protein [Aquisalimonas lutea]MDN3518310.1 hypothetical protein [Aquisalimonas lutea]
MDPELASQLLSQMGELRAAVESTRSVWVIVLPPIITAIVGFLAAIVPTAWLEHRREKRAVKTLRSSLMAELASAASIIRARGYVQDLKEGAEGTREKLQINVPADYFRVFRANVDKLGLLDAAEAARIIQTYQLLESVIQDVIPGGPLHEGTAGPSGFRENWQFLESALHLADKLVSEHARDR